MKPGTKVVLRSGREGAIADHSGAVMNLSAHYEFVLLKKAESPIWVLRESVKAIETATKKAVP